MKDVKLRKKILKLCFMAALNVAIIAGSIAVIVFLSSPDEPPVWGKGDLTPEYQKFFGDNNGARLDFVQDQVMDKHGKILLELSKRVIALEGDPNE
jgi:hypothetical protein